VNILDIIIQIKKQIRRYFLLILILALGVGIAIYYITDKKKATYSCFSKIFPLSINSTGSSGLDALKAQFGVQDQKDLSKIYNVEELVKSKTVTSNVVNTKPYNPKYASYVKWLIDDYNFGLSFWKKKIKYNPKDTVNNILIASTLLSETVTIKTEKTEFIKITTKTYSDTLSKELNEAILENLSSYYLEFSTEKPRNDLAKIQTMRDSLRTELSELEKAIAGIQDENNFVVKNYVGLPLIKLMRAKAEIEELYTMAATSFQNARLKLLSESPIFQILDYPGAPYFYEKSSPIKFGILGFIITFVLISILACRKIIGSIIVKELTSTN
jgi:hypothetical protein